VISFLWTVFFVTEPKSFIEKFGSVPAHFFGVGIITSMFLHSGVFHLAFNMFYLWLFGDNVEDRFSRGGYLLFYILCGICGSVLHSFFHWNSTVPVIGASGAVAGVMGAYMIFNPSATIKVFAFVRTVDVSVITFLGLWFLGQLTFGLMYKIEAASGIAYFSHIGGFVFGAVAACLKKMKSGREGGPK
jgi:membrane associated rhomboid family serine protease